MSLKNLTIEQPTDTIDISEKGKVNEQTISLNRRLFMQLLVFTDAFDPEALVTAVAEVHIHGVLYLDLNDPYGVGLLTFSEEPDYFVTDVRRLLNLEPFDLLTPRPEMTMLGRTYSLGYEADLEHTLITRPIERVTKPGMALGGLVSTAPLRAV